MRVPTTINPGPRSTDVGRLDREIESHPIWTELRGPVNHPVAVGIGLGILSIATGGFGLAAGLAFESGAGLVAAADFTAVAAGAGAALLDQGQCNAGNDAACLGAGLGYAGAAFAFPAFAGDVFGSASGTLGFGLAKGSAALGFGLGVSTLTIDSTLAAFGKDGCDAR